MSIRKKNKSSFNVGDKVKVLTWEEIKEKDNGKWHPYIYPNHPYEYYTFPTNESMFSKTMANDLGGKEFIITKIHWSNRFFLLNTNSNYKFHNYWIMEEVLIKI